ncbi:MAG: MarR family transcriptional regulator [Thermofilum sp.]|nr:helix-turn-helix domain-containing protein [Thermofilum sp.]MCI4407556.1 MarR family transcriptional regulator [Thermofilum sp.]
MSQVQVLEHKGKFILPSGKELTLLDVLSFCYDLSKSDVRVLISLIRSSPKLNEDLEQELQLSKASVNRSLNKLLSLGLVNRIKETGNRAGRPRYVYFAINLEELQSKLAKEIESCVNVMKNLIVAQSIPRLVEELGMLTPQLTRKETGELSQY